MNILTIGDSPYLITRNGKINRDICTHLSSLGHKVDSLVFNHDINYFMPDAKRASYMGKIRLFPFEFSQGAETMFAYETMKKSHPNVVISVGHYAQMDFIHTIKSTYPHLLKWIVITTSGSPIINERHRDALNYADQVIALNTDSYDGLAAMLQTPLRLIPYGAGTEFFDKHEERSGILMSCKNSQISNVPAFLLAMREEKGSLHYNADDTGFYDIPLLVRRYGLEKTLNVPEKFVSAREGVTDDLMNNLYNQHEIFVDCSMQSTTSISMLEAMRTGCIPIGTNVGASKDILSQLPEECRFIVNGENYVGEKEESFLIVSHRELKQTMKKVLKLSQNKEWLAKTRNTVKCVSETFSKDNFLRILNKTVQDTIVYQNTIVVDSLV